MEVDRSEPYLGVLCEITDAILKLFSIKNSVCPVSIIQKVLKIDNIFPIDTVIKEATTRRTLDLIVET